MILLFQLDSFLLIPMVMVGLGLSWAHFKMKYSNFHSPALSPSPPEKNDLTTFNFFPFHFLCWHSYSRNIILDRLEFRFGCEIFFFSMLNDYFILTNASIFIIMLILGIFRQMNNEKRKEKLSAWPPHSI